MDPDEVIILASPQHPIRAKRIKYFEAPLFTGLAEKQTECDFPYPPRVEGTGPWVEEEDDGVAAVQSFEEEEARAARTRRRQARAMHARLKGENADAPRPAEMERSDPVPEPWERTLREQGDFIDELLEER